MTDETQPPKGGFFARAEKAVAGDAERVIAAVEAWYADHFRRAALAGRAPISADEKAELIKATTAAIQPEH